MSASGFMGTAKRLMEHLGVPVGPARLPLTTPSSVQMDALVVRLHELGFAEWRASMRQ